MTVAMALIATGKFDHTRRLPCAQPSHSGCAAQSENEPLPVLLYKFTGKARGSFSERGLARHRQRAEGQVSFLDIGARRDVVLVNHRYKMCVRVRHVTSGEKKRNTMNLEETLLYRRESLA